ncbi:MAG TPA: MFS transporter [Ktedonobacterales bacterium]
MIAERDFALLASMRGLRQGAYSLLAIVLAVTLPALGIRATQIGVMVTVSLLGDLTGTLIIGRNADSWGRRRTLAVLAILMALTGVVFAISRSYPVLLAAAFFGTLGISASETAPFLPIEQAMLGQLGTPAQRVGQFSIYNLVAYIAASLGALLAGIPALVVGPGVSASQSLTSTCAIYTVLALIVAVLATRLSPQTELPEKDRLIEAPGPWWRMILPPLPHSRRIVLTLAGLFSVDAFAGGFISQTLLALFFHLRFGADLRALGVLFFGANVLSGISFLLAPPLARRFGLLNTMVFTHLPSNIFLILVAFMPTFPLAALLLMMRQTLSQLDVPTRQAYTMVLVDPDERTPAASVTSLARSAGSALSPGVSGALLSGSQLVLGLPLIISGGLKAIYDLTIWALFRRVKAPDES